MSAQTERRKHIVLVGTFYPYRGGIVHFLEVAYQGLKERGHQVSAVTFRRQYPELLFPGKTQYEEAPREDIVQAPRLLDTINPLTWFRTARYLAGLKPDALLFKYWMPFFAPAFGTIIRQTRKRGIKALAVVDNAIPHERRPGDLVLSRFFLQACDGLIAMSSVVENDLSRLGVEAPVRRIGHPIYNNFGSPVPRAEARRTLGLDAEAPVMLFFGFIRRYKGLQVLLRSLPRVVARVPDIHLIVAGEFYDDEASYRNLVAQSGLERRVHFFADYIPDEEVALYFAAADVVVQPYVSATQSGVAQIAFHFDKPLIVTDVGGLPEVVPDGKAGLVVPPNDPEALSNAIVRFFEQALSPVLIQGVHEEKQRYSWDRLYEAIEFLIDA